MKSQFLWHDPLLLEQQISGEERAVRDAAHDYCQGQLATRVLQAFRHEQTDTAICSFPRQSDSHVFDELYRAGKVELELVPQGNLAERIRAAGAGIGAFFSPTGFGTELAKGKETREIAGRHYVLEHPIHGDVALVKAEAGDRWGNLVYRKAARNFGPVMATAAAMTVATVHEIRELGGLDPEEIVTPGIFVSRIVKVDRIATQAGGFKKAA